VGAERALASALAPAFLAGEWREEELVRRARDALAPPPRWIPALAREVLLAYPRAPRDRPRELAAFVALALERRLRGRPGRRRERPGRPRERRRFLPTTAMVLPRWGVAPLDTVADLAVLLELEPDRLLGLADARSWERDAAPGPGRHYRYGWRPKAGGGLRLIEAPKPRLRAAQRALLEAVLTRIPPHDAAHGFRRGRSVRSHAAAHAGARVVLRLDLEAFFARVAAGRVYGVFRAAGYPEPVAHLLTALCTNVVPRGEWERAAEVATGPAHGRLGRALATPHLPQGAPTSPALANLAAFGLDVRLAALAAGLGASYTRYADDLAFSGGEEVLVAAPALRAAAARIAREEGFRVNPAKGALMTAAGRQRVCGMVVNVRPNVARPEYDALKAILHNAARRGPAGENRAGARDFRAHLLGRIAWVEALNPARGAKLRARFAAIAWED